VNAVLDPLQLPAALRVLEPDPQAPVLQAWRDRLEQHGLDFDEGSTDAPPPQECYSAVIDMHTPGNVELPAARYPLTAPPGVSLHRFSGAGREVLGVVNRNADSAEVQIAGLDGCTLLGRWHAGELAVVDELHVVLAPHSVQLWEVQR
jgi:hypothetical protein